MAYSLEEIQEDIANLKAEDFYLKYIIRSENWYFENILEIPDSKIIKTVDEFKYIVSSNMKVSFNSIAMVGSGKTGYSFTPKKDKVYKKFNYNESDIDVAIISGKLFDMYWELLRKSYKTQYEALYKHLPQAIYRGYINDKDLRIIDGCRKIWENLIASSKKALHTKLYIQHEINYRLYRSWEDFEDYHVSGINKIKRGFI